MRTVIFAAMIAVAVPAVAAKSPPPKEPEVAALKHAGDICKAIGGFGRVFGRGDGLVDTTANDDWAPFEKLTITTGEITAEASFHGAGDSLEDDVAQAEKFLKRLDHAITAKGHFPHRETSGNAIRFSAGKEGAGVTLIVEQEQDHIVAVCAGG